MLRDYIDMFRLNSRTGTNNFKSNNIEERKFIEGPHSRKRDLWFLVRVMLEFFKGFRTLHFVGPCVTVFGSARIEEDHPYYLLAREVGRRLAGLGLTVMTGGGPGLMEAANRGAKEAGGKSIGCNILLQEEQEPNPYVDCWVTFKYFFVRKVMLFKYSYAFIVLPGGAGTMDEFFEALTLIQTKKIHNFPLVLMSNDYFNPLKDYLDSMVRESTIDATDLDLLLFTDSVDEAMSYIRRQVVETFGLDLKRLPKPSLVLGE